MFRFLFSVVIVALLLDRAASVSQDYPDPPATFEAKEFTTWSHRRVHNSSKASIYVPFTAADGSDDLISVKRLDLVGTDYERGYSHGYLLAKDIFEFQGYKLDMYFREMVMDIDISGFPDALQKILHVIQVKGAMAAPAAFREAMAWVWEKEKSYVPTYILDELNGLGVGICDAVRHDAAAEKGEFQNLAELAGLKTGEDCDPAQWTEQISALNMLPELIRMACTAYGAWGPATAADRGLVQLRALDFGGGPFANYTVAAVYRDSPESSGDGSAFVSITFPGFVGVITGVSQSGIGVSEKVWMTYDRFNLQPGSYDGLADVFVLREILQHSKTRQDAENYLLNVNRTWAIWIGVGDYNSQVLDLVGYTQSEVGLYTDVTMPTMTGQPYIPSVAYVDKHPQPSGEGPNGTLPTALNDFYGNISCETSKIVTQYHKTGDLHIASYDFLHREMYLAVGRINQRGEYAPMGSEDTSVWKAYNRPYLKFSLPELWKGVI